MVDKQPGLGPASDDLDLMRLLERIFSFFSIYGRRIIFFSAAGILAGIALYKLSPKVYESTLLLHSSTLTNTEQINIIENWNALLRAGEYKTLGERLNCEPAMLKKLIKIAAVEIQKLYIPNNPNGFEVKAVVTDNSILDSLGAGIVYGFGNSDYIKLKLQRRRATLSTLIEKVKAEIGKLDSTKSIIEKGIGSNARTSSFVVDISTINSLMISLNEKLLGYQDELKFTNAVEVFHKFEKFENPVSPKLFKWALLGLMAGFTVGYVSSLYSFFRQKMTIYHRSMLAA